MPEMPNGERKDTAQGVTREKKTTVNDPDGTGFPYKSPMEYFLKAARSLYTALVPPGVRQVLSRFASLGPKTALAS